MPERKYQPNSDVNVETIIGDSRTPGIPGGVSLSLRMRAALEVFRESLLHPEQISYIVVNPSNKSVTVERESKKSR